MLKFLTILLLLVSLLIPSFAYAHPGRTDSNGGHYCRTNCTKWGLEFGEYHYHSKPIKQARTNAKGSARKKY